MAIYFADEAQTRAAHVINVTEKTSANRVVLSNVTNNNIANLWDMGTINKKVSGSIIVCTGVIQGHSANNSGHVMPLYQLHNSDYRGGWSSSYLSQNYNVSCPIAWSVVGETATGNIAVKIKYTDNNAGGGEKPFDVFNPNQNDDNRMNGGVYSRAMIWEILL